MSKFHHHVDENGLLVRCYHKSKTALCSVGFWAGVTISFPIEHFLWTKVPPLNHLAEWLGLISGH